MHQRSIHVSSAEGFRLYFHWWQLANAALPVLQPLTALLHCSWAILCKWWSNCYLPKDLLILVYFVQLLQITATLTYHEIKIVSQQSCLVSLRVNHQCTVYEIQFFHFHFVFMMNLISTSIYAVIYQTSQNQVTVNIIKKEANPIINWQNNTIYSKINQIGFRSHFNSDV